MAPVTDGHMAATNGNGVMEQAKAAAAQTVEKLQNSVSGDSKAQTSSTSKLWTAGTSDLFTHVPEIKQEDIDHWHKHGYVIIKNFLSQEELAAVHADFNQYMPTWEEFSSRPKMFENMDGQQGRSSLGWVRIEFPYHVDAVNKMQVHPFLAAFAERLVGHKNIALSHGAIVGKYAGKADYDQPLHPDYTNNTLVLPRRDTESIDIPMIVYYTDVTVDLGPTYVVSKTLTDNLISDGQRYHTREDFPELYKAEVPAVCPAGSVLIYNMRTFHRGSRMYAKEGLRYTQFIAFHTTDKPWLGSDTFQRNGGQETMDRFLTNATPRERELVGFPAPNDPYWQDEEARLGVSNRYPKMDMTPYGGRP